MDYMHCLGSDSTDKRFIKLVFHPELNCYVDDRRTLHYLGSAPTVGRVHQLVINHLRFESRPLLANFSF